MPWHWIEAGYVVGCFVLGMWMVGAEFRTPRHRHQHKSWGLPRVAWKGTPSGSHRMVVERKVREQ